MAGAFQGAMPSTTPRGRWDTTASAPGVRTVGTTPVEMLPAPTMWAVFRARPMASPTMASAQNLEVSISSSTIAASVALPRARTCQH